MILTLNFRACTEDFNVTKRHFTACANIVAMFTSSQNQRPLREIGNNFKILVLKAGFDRSKVTHHCHRLVSGPLRTLNPFNSCLTRRCCHDLIIWPVMIETEMDWWLNLDRALPVFLLGDCDHVHCERNHPQQRCIFKRTRWDTLSPRWLVRGWGDVYVKEVFEKHPDGNAYLYR